MSELQFNMVKNEKVKSKIADTSTYALTFEGKSHEIYVSDKSLDYLSELAKVANKKQLRNINVGFVSKDKKTTSVYRMHFKVNELDNITTYSDIIKALMSKSKSIPSKFHLLKTKSWKLVECDNKSFPTSLFIIEV